MLLRMNDSRLPAIVASITLIAFLVGACGNITSVPMVTVTLEPTSFSTPDPHVLLDSAYYDGILVITQYYTFLGHGLHEEAYNLLSTSEQNHTSLEDYLKNTHMAFKTVEIISIQPYYVAVIQQGGQTTPDSSDRKRFVAKIRSWGEGNMSGSVTNGTLQTLFLGLVQEEGRWKIDSFATAPLQ